VGISEKFEDKLSLPLFRFTFQKGAKRGENQRILAKPGVSSLKNSSQQVCF